MHPGVIGCLTYILSVGVASTVLAQRLDVDWKLYGGASVNGDSLCFYDEKGITRQPDGHIRVWTKCISKADLDDAFRKDPDKNIVEATAQKVMQGYMPPILKLPQTDAADAMIYTGYEEVADLGRAVQPQSRILYELNCPHRMMRELSMELHINDKVGFVDKPREMALCFARGQWSGIIENSLSLRLSSGD